VAEESCGKRPEQPRKITVARIRLQRLDQRFKTLPELALDVVESTVVRLPVEDYTAGYQAMRDAMGKGKGKAKRTSATRSN
jgi:hypothetical protein